jgi:hypothetical protein
MGVCVHIMKEDRRAMPNKPKKEPPPNSMAARDRDFEREEKRKSEDWDHTTPADLIGREFDLVSRDREEFGWSS